MSEVTEDSGVLTAGNTVETLQSVDRDEAAGLPTAADLDATVAEGSVPVVNEVVNNTQEVAPTTVDELLDEENTFDVSRAEFNELRDLALSLQHGIESYNVGAPHKIPLVSINTVLGIK